MVRRTWKGNRKRRKDISGLTVEEYRAGYADEIRESEKRWMALDEDEREARYIRAGRELAAELIRTSMMDVRNLRAYVATSRNGIRLKPRQVEQMDAFEWFRRRSVSIGGYGWALAVTGLNPNLIRAEIGKRDPLEGVGHEIEE